MHCVQTVLVDGTVTPIRYNLNYNLDPSPTDVWLFTDPGAKAIYARHRKLAELEKDIRAYAMFKGVWSPDELEFKQEVQRLVKLSALTPRPAFGHLSPHPTIYRATREGRIRVDGMNFSFRCGDDIVFVPWVERLNRPGLLGPMRIDRLNTTSHYALCQEEYPQMKDLSGKDLKILHQIIYSYKK